MLHDLVRRVERIEALDWLAGPLVGVISPAVRPRAVRNLLSGTYVGHPLHPMLTDLPTGAWGLSAVLADADLAGGEHRKVEAAGIPVLLCRMAGRLCALASTCSHMGGPLAEGMVGDGCVTCPWHGSIFRLADGGIVRGPASTPHSLYQAQIRDGQVEVRVSP